ncbi:phospholipase A and acyltransferase 3-like isoform X2 [Oenanthe melanoleuca]|uniref:phospholipase A and acyltransferase 3-like isoform X2 n=1 Tax=Oenanthe melanoleuca TaxID=2939378 RepID=UPI0024C13D98|nr:phospholipase A and acyltransferase 3-like isoform X2 [Oenanthe melanoleuca]
MGQKNSNPQPGDLIEIFRRGYRHWALYMGDGYVIHVTDEGIVISTDGITSTFSGKATVKKELLTEVAGNAKWRVNNKYDRRHVPFSVEEIIQRAESCVGREVEFSVLNNNCEHFVTELRYGVRLSDQVRNVVFRTVVAAETFLLSHMATAVVKSFSSNSSKERNC